jgi:hypothetical protein
MLRIGPHPLRIDGAPTRTPRRSSHDVAGRIAMSEQPTSEQPSAAHEAPSEPRPDSGAEEESIPHGHVRTEGEISVDDALGATDDPR